MKVSIITVVLNRRDTIAQSIRSVAEQDYFDVEHIIQDGVSTDGTLEVVKSIVSPKLLVFSEPDCGIYDALNRGIARASGDIVGVVHSDDVLAHPSVLSRVVHAFENFDVDGVYGDLDYVSASSGGVVRRWKAGVYSKRALMLGWMPPHPTLFLRRSVFEKWGLYDTSFQIAGDYEAVVRYCIRGDLSLSYLEETLVKMRLGGVSNRNLRSIVKKMAEDLLVMRTYGLGGYGTLAMKSARKIPQVFVRSTSNG